MTIKTTIELEIEVGANVTPYVPAQTSGPPENCYPEEGGESEIQSVHVLDESGGKAKAEPVEITHLLSPKQIEQLEQECMEKATEDSRRGEP